MPCGCRGTAVRLRLRTSTSAFRHSILLSTSESTASTIPLPLILVLFAAKVQCFVLATSGFSVSASMIFLHWKPRIAVVDLSPKFHQRIYRLYDQPRILLRVA